MNKQIDYEHEIFIENNTYSSDSCIYTAWLQQ